MFNPVFKTLFPRFEDDESSISSSKHAVGDDPEVPDLSELSDSQSSRGDINCGFNDCFVGDENSPPDVPHSAELDQIMVEYQGHPSSDPNFATKEDQDVAVFLGLADRMAVKSLLFILQGHARSMHNISQDQLQKVLERQEAKARRKEQAKLSQSHHSMSESVTAEQPVKQFRFADILGGQQVRVSVHAIPAIEDEDKPIIWWQQEDMTRMIQEAVRVVRYYKKNRRSYMKAINVLAESYQPDTDDRTVEKYMKKLSADSVARGLEPHLVLSLNTCRKRSVKAVLEEQAARRRQAQQALIDHSSSRHSSSSRPNIDNDNGESFYKNASFAHSLECEVMADAIRRRYRKATLPCRTLAIKLGEWDHVEALKSTLSRWGTPKPLQELDELPRSPRRQSTSEHGDSSEHSSHSKNAKTNKKQISSKSLHSKSRGYNVRINGTRQ